MAAAFDHHDSNDDYKDLGDHLFLTVLKHSERGNLERVPVFKLKSPSENQRTLMMTLNEALCEITWLI